MPAIANLGERALIDRLRNRVGPIASPVVIGIGDDAAVIEPERGALDVVTTDSLVEGVHFRRDWTSAAAIGHKALAVSLSDLAAMGATPRASLLSLALPPQFEVDDFDALVDAFVRLAQTSGATLVGGNLTRSPGPVIVDVTAMGAVARRRLLRRDTARAGDALYVTGHIGAAAAGLLMLEAGVDRATLDRAGAECLERYERPDPRTRCGRIVGRTRAASACIDLSDGLADAVRRLAEGCGAGAVIEAEAVPVHAGLQAWAAARGLDATTTAISGGEDYELAFAVSPRRRNRFLGATRRCKDLPVTCIGRLVPEPGVWLTRNGTHESVDTGYSHF